MFRLVSKYSGTASPGNIEIMNPPIALRQNITEVNYNHREASFTFCYGSCLFFCQHGSALQQIEELTTLN